MSELLRTTQEIHKRALLYAAENNQPQAIEMLEAPTSTIECKDSNGNTPLLVAISKGCLGAAKILLDKGANINAQNKAKETALIIATKKAVSDRKFIEVMNFLDDYKPDVTLTDADGKTFIQYIPVELMRHMPRWIDYAPIKKEKITIPE